MLKKLLSMALCAIMVMGMGTTAFAAELKTVDSPDAHGLISPTTNVTGERILTDTENNQYLQGLTKEELQKINEKDLRSQKIAGQAKAGTKVSIPGTFNMYQQETDTYCIPATIKSTLMYINGSSPTQSSIASTVGTDSSKIAKYLNDRQSDCYYVYVAMPSQTDMCNKLYSTISSSQVPASMGISGTTSSNWYYATSGHSLIVNAIYSDYSKIQFGDPLGNRVAGCPYYYEKTASLASSVCRRIVY